MSQLLQVASRKGNISIFGVPPAFFDQGIPYAGADQLSYEQTGAIDHYHQGLPFTASGALAATLAGTPVRFYAGVPYSSTGHVCFGNGATAYHNTGIAYTALGQIKIT